MGKQRKHRSQNQASPSRTVSVNPLGESPDKEEKGQVLTDLHEKAKKENTK
ncbi:hypothetical protein K8O68_05705 [Salipaludibacillus sp. CUR1]|uniref:Uncharacterized protein n=1 Tax=Salipaludibacillus aurantiacus TaxID=1601833 RepID=A0A1H9VQ51_9BACI|nr:MULTISPECIES: hypothetical protein [Salipaludibacillus]MCE7791913.1 hypothetical protein [Salipaludibacillus sp. CUR1]SES23712.1 hypothetical protein SAMN05518684_1126 [Salipaludibacillus aurantiacus]